MCHTLDVTSANPTWDIAPIPPMALPHSTSKLAIEGNKLYVIGGAQKLTISMFDIEEDMWSDIATMPSIMK